MKNPLTPAGIEPATLLMVWYIPQIKNGTRSMLCNRPSVDASVSNNAFKSQPCLTPGEQVTKNCLNFLSRNFRY